METYSPPLTDIMFALDSLANVPGVLQQPAFAEVDSDLVQAVVSEAANFFAAELAPTNSVGDRQGVLLVDGAVKVPDCFLPVYKLYREQGWASVFYATSEGGYGLPTAVTFAVIEMMQSANLAFSMCPLLAPAAVDTLRRYAPVELADTYVPRLVSGEWSATMALTEPQAGSDLSLVRCKAVPDGDSYLISGQKIFISFADHNMTDNIVHLVLARLPDAPAGVNGISLFVVPKFIPAVDGNLGERNDICITGIEHKLGLHASPTCSVSFGEAGGARGYLVGEPHKGLSYMFTMMNHARLQVGSQAVALSEVAYQAALAFVHERRQGRVGRSAETATLVQHADVQRMLMTIRAGTEAMRGFTYTTATTMDLARLAGDEDTRRASRSRVEWLTPIIKAWNTELVQEMTALCVQIHGGMGFVEETGVAQLLRDARILTIYEGTTGIQAMDLVRRKLLKDRGEACRQWLAEMTDTSAQARRQGILVAEANAFDVAVETLRQSTARLCEWAADPDADLGRVAYDYLMSCGYVGGGWQLLRGALLAAEESSSSVSENDKQQRLQISGFYMANILPRAGAHSAVLDAVISGMGQIDTSSFRLN